MNTNFELRQFQTLFISFMSCHAIEFGISFSYLPIYWLIPNCSRLPFVGLRKLISLNWDLVFTKIKLFLERFNLLWAMAKSISARYVKGDRYVCLQAHVLIYTLSFLQKKQVLGHVCDGLINCLNLNYWALEIRE